MFTRIHPLPFFQLAALLLSTMLLLTGCGLVDDLYDGHDDDDNPSATVEEVFHYPDFIENADGDFPTDLYAPLYEIQKHNPILAPDGHHVTLAEFNAVKGKARMECVDGGTYVTAEMEGLIPYGVYTLWYDVYEAPGYEPTFAHEIGLGPMGPQDGTQNAFIASKDGTAKLAATTPAGALGMFGETDACGLTDEFEVQIVGSYHLDRKTYRAEEGPAGTAAAQFAFVFKDYDEED